MDTRALLYGLIGFFIGGLLVAIAASTFNREELQDGHSGSDDMSYQVTKRRVG